MKRWFAGAAIASVSLLGVAIITAGAEETLEQDANRTSRIDLRNLQDAVAQIREGKEIFRNDTFGDQAFWDVASARRHRRQREWWRRRWSQSKAALSLGLKVDADALPDPLRSDLLRKSLSTELQGALSDAFPLRGSGATGSRTQ